MPWKCNGPGCCESCDESCSFTCIDYTGYLTGDPEAISPVGARMTVANVADSINLWGIHTTTNYLGTAVVASEFQMTGLAALNGTYDEDWATIDGRCGFRSALEAGQLASTVKTLDLGTITRTTYLLGFPGVGGPWCPDNSGFTGIITTMEPTTVSLEWYPFETAAEYVVGCDPKAVNYFANLRVSTPSVATSVLYAGTKDRVNAVQGFRDVSYAFQHLSDSGWNPTPTDIDTCGVSTVRFRDFKFDGASCWATWHETGIGSTFETLTA